MTIAKNYGSMYCVEGLDSAADAILAQRQAQAEKVAAQRRLFAQIEKYCDDQHIAKTDKIVEIMEEIERVTPPITFAKFLSFAELHPDRVDALVGFKAFSKLDAVRHAPVGQRELRRKYGDALVDQALETLRQRIHKGTEQIEDRRAAERCEQETQFLYTGRR